MLPAVAAGMVLAMSSTAQAQNTWRSPAIVAGPVLGTFDFNAGANWSSGGVPLQSTATLSASTTPNISFSADLTEIGQLNLVAGASAYTMTLNNTLVLSGAGITISGGSLNIIVNPNFVDTQRGLL